MTYIGMYSAATPCPMHACGWGRILLPEHAAALVAASGERLETVPCALTATVVHLTYPNLPSSSGVAS